MDKFGGAISSAARPLDLARPVIVEPGFAPLETLPASISVQKAYYVTLQPNTAAVNCTAGNKLRFDIPADSASFLDLASSYIIIRANVTTSVGGNLVVGKSVSLKENFPQLLFGSGMRLSVNSVDVSDQVGLEGHAASFYKDLLFGKRERFAGQKQLYTSGAGTGASSIGGGIGADLECINLTQAGELGDVVPIGTANNPTSNDFVTVVPSNSGAYYRAALFQGAAVNDFETLLRPALAVWRQPGFLPPGTAVSLEITRASSDTLPLFSAVADIPKINLTGATLYVRRVFPTPAAHEAAASAIASYGSFRYPMLWARSSLTAIPQSTSTSLSGVLVGVVPDLVILAVAANQAWGGSMRQNPYYTARTFDANPAGAAVALTVTSLFVEVGGQRYPATDPYSTDSAAGTYLGGARAYLDYLAASGRDLWSEDEAPISYKQWRDTYRFYVVCLRDDNENMIGRATDDERTGRVDVSLQFGAAPVAASLYTLGLSHAEMRVHADRRVEVLQKL